MSTPAVTPAEQYARFRERQAAPEFTSFRELYDFDFDPFQVAACGALTAGDGVLVAAPTGSGKTVVGEYAVHLALEQGRKCFYTTPIKALSNQKYNDLVRRYDADTVGLLTGDNSVNGNAPVVVMTTEVLRNMLYAGSPALRGLGYVVLDEVHYLADRARGAVWEEVIIHLPESVRVVALSATVSNAEEFGDWLSQVRGGGPVKGEGEAGGGTAVIVDEHRPVPLWQHMLVGRHLYDLFTDDEHHQVNPELTRIARRDAYRAPSSRPARGGHRPRRPQPPYRPDIIDRLDAAGLLPAITFIFSRAGCDEAVQQCLAAGLRLTTPDEAAHIETVAAQRTADLPDEDLAVLGYHDWVTGLRRGITAHHAGMLPAFKEVVEELFAAGLVRAVFATETLALGVNMPARTVVIERLDKWNGEAHAALTPGEYTQLTGRAGRRGIDVEGHAVVLWQPGIDPGAVAGLAGTRTYPLNSSFRPSYNMAVNLTARAGRARAAQLLESSFAQFQADRGVVGLTRRLRRVQASLAELVRSMTCDRGDFLEYARLRRELTDAERGVSRNRASAQREEARRVLATLRRGDIIRVPSGRRAGMAVVLEPPPRAESPVRADGPLVLTAHGQLKQLSAADFPVPAEPVDRLRVPNWFSERSAKHRRDLVSSMRSKLAGKSFDYPERPRGARAADGASGADSGRGDIAELRRKLRRHPCHDCPDREQHARYAERYFRQQKEVAELERQIGGRSHVIARTFGKVCAVLDELGYLDGDAVTADGKRLTRLYSELDLLAAECLRRGFWEGLNPAELAACVSVLSYESRQAYDDGPPARLPKGPVRDVLNAMTRAWAELDQLEKRSGLSFLREPDTGFVWAAFRWARGAKLEDVLDAVPGLTPGDFVRSVKQLIDLLDQIAAATATAPVPAPADRERQNGEAEDAEAAEAEDAEAEDAERPRSGVAPRDRDVAATARAAIDALRRGVVAYTSLAD
jgi:ATP-dependent RNA helicase HelY